MVNSHYAVYFSGLILSKMLHTFYIAETQTFRAWSRYRYGVFGESGVPGDKLYPDTFKLAGQDLDNQGCKLNQTVSCHILFKLIQYFNLRCS